MSEQLEMLEGGVCASCKRVHFDGNWLICDECDDSLLRAWLKWSVDFADAARVVGLRETLPPPGLAREAWRLERELLNQLLDLLTTRLNESREVRRK